MTLRLIDPERTAWRDLDRFNCGQGTINVVTWSPDSRRLANVSYSHRPA